MDNPHYGNHLCTKTNINILACTMSMEYRITSRTIKPKFPYQYGFVSFKSSSFLRHFKGLNIFARFSLSCCYLHCREHQIIPAFLYRLKKIKAISLVTFNTPCLLTQEIGEVFLRVPYWRLLQANLCLLL